MPRARCGTRSWDSSITPWTKGGCQTAEPPRDPLFTFFKFFFKFLFIYDSHREREREAETQAEGEAGSMRETDVGLDQAPCREPDVGLDPGTPVSRPGLKVDAQLLSHPGIPSLEF